MSFILKNILYILPVFILAVVIGLKRRFLIKKIKEKTTLLWIVVLIIIFFIIYFLSYYASDNNISIIENNNYGPEIYEYIVFYACVTCSLCWYILKLICKSQGYPVSCFVNHQWDIKNSVNIIKHDDRILIKLFTALMLIGVFTSLIIAAIAFFYI